MHRRLAALVILAALPTACINDAGTAAPPDFGAVDLTGRTVVDLTQPIAPGMPLWPGDPAVEVESVATIAADGYFLRRFGMGEHSGTHMNAANSFVEGGRSIDQYPASELTVPAVVVDVTAEAVADPDYALTIDRVQAWERRHGRIPAGAMVLVRTGWSARWDNPVAFLGLTPDGGLHFPGIAGDTARWLYQQRRIAGVGIDTHGVDPGQDPNFETNVVSAERSAIVLECLDDLDRLPARGITLVIAPTELTGGSGAPATVRAVVRD